MSRLSTDWSCCGDLPVLVLIFYVVRFIISDTNFLPPLSTVLGPFLWRKIKRKRKNPQ